MAKHLLLAAILLVASVHSVSMMNNGAFATCPSGGVPAVAGKLSINMKGDVPLQPGNDIQCYNHTLMTPFDCSPDVAIGNNNTTQVSTISKHKTPPIISSSPSKPSTPIAMPFSPSSSEPTGLTPDGQRSTSSSWHKHPISSKQATTK